MRLTRSTKSGEIGSNRLTQNTSSIENPQSKYAKIVASKGFGDYLAQINFPSQQIKDRYFAADQYYESGSYADSLKILRELEELNFAPAIFSISMFYEKGQFVAQDYQKAFEYIERSANMGYDRAQFRLGQLFDPQTNALDDQDQAMKYYKLAASQGFPDAIFNLATWYDSRSMSRVRLNDPAQALSLYRVAATAGLRYAQLNLGIIYLNGFDVDRDAREALKWLEAAADQGDPNAQFNIGLMYEKGDFVDKNLDTALKYFKRAAAGGNERAKTRYADVERIVASDHANTELQETIGNKPPLENVARCSEVDPVSRFPLFPSNDIFLNWSNSGLVYISTDSSITTGNSGISMTTETQSQDIPTIGAIVDNNVVSFTTAEGNIWRQSAFWKLDRSDGFMMVDDANSPGIIFGAYECIKGTGGL